MVAARYRHHLTSTNVRFDPTQEAMLRRSECRFSANFVEKHRVAGAESGVPN
jgi:hypothetical protein